MVKIVDHRMEDEYNPKNIRNCTYVGPLVVGNAWTVVANLPDLEPGEYNITIIINSSQGSFENTTVSQSYADKVVIEDPPVEELAIAEILVAGAIAAIVILFVIQVWRTRHDWG